MPDSVVTYATDACLQLATCDTLGRKQIGVVHITRKRATSWFKTQHEDVYIGVAELRAILFAVRHAKNLGRDISLIVIATDSLCAKGWVERRYAERSDARQVLRELAMTLGDRTRLACTYVPTGDNVADEPSRCDLNDNNPRAIKLPQLEATSQLLNSVLCTVGDFALIQGKQVIVIRRERPMEEKVETKSAV
jgi:hypothetical protein